MSRSANDRDVKGRAMRRVGNTVAVRDPCAIRKYEFCTRTAASYRCAKRGVFLFVTSVIGDREHAVSNANTLDGHVPSTVSPVAFEGEDIGARLARRIAT